MHLCDAGLGDDGQRVAKRDLGLGREADDHVGRQVEVVLQRCNTRQVAAGRVATRHVAKHAVVAGLERDVHVPADGRRLAQGGDELVVDVVDLDRREAQARQAGDRSSLADEPGKPVPALAIAIAPEVDSGQHHLAVALRDPPLDLAQDGLSGPAARRTAHERDDAEVAREATTVLDLHERAHAIETRIGLDAGDRADIAGDGGRGLLAAAGDHDHVLREAVERCCEIGTAARDVDAAVGSRGPRSRMPRLAHGLVRDTAGVHNRDVARIVNLGMTVGEEAFADELRVGV